jgi:hypothetical protein
MTDQLTQQDLIVSFLITHQGLIILNYAIDYIKVNKQLTILTGRTYDQGRYNDCVVVG